MATITITGDSLFRRNYPRKPGFLYLFPRTSFWLADRTPVFASSPYDNGIPFLRVLLTEVPGEPNEYTYPDFDMPSTEDAIINFNTARWGLFVFDDADAPRLIDALPGLESFHVPASPTTHNLLDLAGYQNTSFDPVTDGDRVILGDLYAANGFFSGDVTALHFIGDGSALTGIAAGTGGVTNTGSTTIGADTDVNGSGIISLQTRTIERVNIANDGALNALFAMNVTGLSTLAGGAQFNATQAKWSTGNIAAPSDSDQNAGSRLILYPAASGEHFAIGVESGVMWRNVSAAGAYKDYFGASNAESVLHSAHEYLIISDGDAFDFHYQSNHAAPVLNFEVSSAPMGVAVMRWLIDGASMMELGADAFFPLTDNATELGTSTKRWQDGYFTRIHVTEGQYFEFALSDETTAITTGTAKLTWRAPFAFTLVSVRASLGVTSSSGIPTVDINEGGTTILSTKLTVDVGEKTSVTAAVPAVISDTAIASDAEITFDVDVAGTGTKGLKVKLFYTV